MRNRQSLLNSSGKTLLSGV